MEFLAGFNAKGILLMADLFIYFICRVGAVREPPLPDIKRKDSFLEVEIGG